MKTSPFARTFAAALVAAALGAYAYFVESKKPAQSEESKTKEKVFSLDKAKVKELTLIGGGETIKLEKQGGNWRLSAPLSVPADNGAADQIVASLEGLEIDAEVAPNAPSLKDFGLDAPERTVTVQQDGSPPSQTLLIGSKLVDGSGVYAKTPEKTRIFSLPSFSVSSLEKKPFDLRDRDLLHVKRDAVKSLEVTGPEGAYALARDASGEWGFTKPGPTRAGRWSVDSLLGSLEGLRMESVAAEEAKDPRKFGLDKPARTITLGLADGTSKTLEIGSSAGDKKWNARERAASLVAVIPAALVDELAKGMGELRAKRLLEVATYEIEGFDASEGSAKRSYVKTTTKDAQGLDTAKWKRTAPDQKELDKSKVEDALFKVGGIEIQEFVDAPKAPEAYGLDQPAFSLVLRSGAGKPEQTISLGRKDSLVYARRPGDASVLKLDAAKAEELIKAFREL